MCVRNIGPAKSLEIGRVRQIFTKQDNNEKYRQKIIITRVTSIKPFKKAANYNNY